MRVDADFTTESQVKLRPGLEVALAPCEIGCAEIATRLASRPDAHAATNPVWIAEYAGAQ